MQGQSRQDFTTFFILGLAYWCEAQHEDQALWIICREGWVAQKGNTEHFSPLEASNSWEPEGWDCASISAHCWAQLSRAALPTCTDLWFMWKTLSMKALCPRRDWQVFKSLPNLKRSKLPPGAQLNPGSTQITASLPAKLLFFYFFLYFNIFSICFLRIFYIFIFFFYLTLE